MATHELKTWTDPFRAMWRGDKTAEFRPDDRTPPYARGDRLRLREWEPTTGVYSGREIDAEVTDVRRGGTFGIPEGYCMLSLDLLRGRYTRGEEDGAIDRAGGEVTAS